MAMADKKHSNGFSNPSLGQFNVFRLAPILERNNKPTVYRARAHFKITLVKGKGVFHYAILCNKFHKFFKFTKF